MFARAPAPSGDVRGVGIVSVELMRTVDVVEVVSLKKNLRFDTGAHAIVGRGRAVVVVEKVVSSVAHPWLALDDVVGPPVVVPGHVERNRGGKARRGRIRTADQVGEAMTCGARRVVPFIVGARCVRELRPRDRDEIGIVGDVEVAVGAVLDGAVVEPDVMSVAIDRDGVVAGRAACARVVVRVERAVAHAVARDLNVPEDRRPRCQTRCRYDLGGGRRSSSR